MHFYTMDTFGYIIHFTFIIFILSSGVKPYKKIYWLIYRFYYIFYYIINIFIHWLIKLLFKTHIQDDLTL